MDRVDIKVEGHIAIVSLNRPDKMNALDIEMFNDLIEAGKTVEQNKEIRCVVLRGEGRAFCAGLDLANFNPEPDSDFNQKLETRTHGIANMWQKAVWTWRECSVPVIAAVHGIAFGGGLQVMSGTDIKFIHPDTKLSIMEVKWGIIPDMGGSQLWRHNVREDILKELTYTHRIFSGTQGVEYGFATHVSENPYEAAMTLAQEISHKSPNAIVNSKKLLNECHYHNDVDGLIFESLLQDEIIRKPNQYEAVYSQMQKRKGKFSPYRRT